MNTESLPRSERSIKHNESFLTLRLALISLLIIWLLFSVIGYIDSETKIIVYCSTYERERKKETRCKFVTFWNAPMTKRSCPCHLFPPAFLHTKKVEREINYCQRSGCDPLDMRFIRDSYIIYRYYICKELADCVIRRCFKLNKLKKRGKKEKERAVLSRKRSLRLSQGLLHRSNCQRQNAPCNGILEI